MRSERGQGTVEWVGIVCVVCLLLVGVLATGVAVSGIDLARSIAGRILCAVELADGCGDEPVLIATYGDEIGRLVREHMPTIGFEEGSKAVPVDYRRCRETSCGDAPDDGLVHRTDERLPVTAFTHVVDCRAPARAETEAAGIDCSGDRAGRLYIQYWLYYANSATLRGVPVVGDAGEHRDDWESVQVRINPDGTVDERASAHDGYDYSLQDFDWGSDAGIGILSDLAEDLGGPPPERLGPGDRPPARLRRQPRRQRHRRPAWHPLHPRPSRPPGPAGADRRRLPRHLRRRPALAEGSLARPRGRRDRLGTLRRSPPR